MTHRPALASEVLTFLNLKRGDVVLDATVGGGGHAKDILNIISPGGLLIGIDVDPKALEIARNTLRDFNGFFKLLNDNFKRLDSILSKEGIKSLDAVLFDIGISSYQIDDSSRGFSIRSDGPLDMRMDPNLKVTAYNIVNKYTERDLSEIMKKFGEERYHNRVANFIVKERSKKPIETTGELVGIIHKAIGSRYRRQRIDPATRTFQAIRIVVNDELNTLEEGIKKAVPWLRTGGRICVISFHSLEDRIVKHLFRGYLSLGILKLVTKKLFRPSREEVFSNPRSRSAKLRVAERM